MSKSNAAENAILQAIYNAVAWADLLENDGTSPATNIAVALHTADPGEAGDQTTNEADYTGYARVNVARTSGGWTVSGNSVVNAAEILFGEKTAGADDTLTHFSTGRPGSDEIIHSGALTASLLVSDGVQPRFPAGDITITED